MKRILTAIAAITLVISAYAENALTPDGTYLFAQRDTCDLFLDIYNPTPGSQTAIDGIEKPTIIFIFGGGFIMGERNSDYYFKWFQSMKDNGYRIVSIDYRLGLKGAKKVGVTDAGAVNKAIHLGVEDLFSATNFLADNSEQLGIDPSNIVISGSSAGAIISLQAEYEICNETSWTKTLPEGFRYAGVMAFAGAILSYEGLVDYKVHTPAPTLMLHGTADKLVPYKQIAVLNLGFYGGGALVKRLEKYGCSYNMYHFVDYGHEIAISMENTTDLQQRFLETNVMKGKKRIIEAWISDPDVEKGTMLLTRRDLYK